VPLATDADHCGACGNRCPNGNTCFNGACIELGAIRMARYYGNDTGTSSGRPEMFRTNGWYNVTSPSSSAWIDVVCRQLGFAGGVVYSSSSSNCSGCGSLQSVSCTGTEALLADCSFSATTSSFSGYTVTCTVN
jgi:ferredoxin